MSVPQNRKRLPAVDVLCLAPGFSVGERLDQTWQSAENWHMSDSHCRKVSSSVSFCVPSSCAASRNEAHVWRAPGMPDVRMLRATFTSYAYDRHEHEEYVLGAVECGVQRFYHKGGDHFAVPGTLFTINPDEVHAGESAIAEGYTYRAAYVSEDFLQQAFADVPGASVARYFRAPDAEDADLAPRFARALALLEAPGSEVLQAQSEFILCLRDLFSRYAAADGADRIDGNATLVRRLKEYLRENAVEGVSLDDLAQEAGLSKYHVLRMFKAATGLAPHAYLMQRRVEIARGALDAGATPADAAAVAGFTDQSHLTRRFKPIYGITPGAYRRQIFQR